MAVFILFVYISLENSIAIYNIFWPYPPLPPFDFSPLRSSSSSFLLYIFFITHEVQLEGPLCARTWGCPPATSLRRELALPLQAAANSQKLSALPHWHPDADWLSPAPVSCRQRTVSAWVQGVCHVQETPFHSYPRSLAQTPASSSSVSSAL